MFEFRQLRYTIAVAKYGGFTAAAEHLNVSQSAVSEQVRLLEDRIGFRLLERTGRGVKVTDRGKVFLWEAERVATGMTYLAKIANQLAEPAVEKLNIGMVSGIAPVLLPRLFPDGNVPANVRLEIHTATTRVIFEDLCGGRIDVGFAVELDPDLVPSGLIVNKLFETELVLATSKGHPLSQGGGPVEVTRLAREPVIMSELTVGYGHVVMKMFGELGISPPIPAVVDNVETMKVMVRSGTGHALIPVGAADNEVQLGLVDVVPIVPACRIKFESYRPHSALSPEKELIHDAIMARWNDQNAVGGPAGHDGSASLGGANR